MTDSVTEAPTVGDVVELDQHRARTAPVRLVKGTDAPALARAVDVDQEQLQLPVEDAARPVGDGKRARGLACAARRVCTVATHEKSRSGARLMARHTAYVVGGAGVVVKRTWHGRTVTVHHQLRAAAVAAGNYELASEWQEKADKFRSDRHRRRMELIQGVPNMAKSTVIGAAGVEGGLLLLGACMAIHDHQLHDVVVPTMAAIDAIRAVCWFIGIAWGPALRLHDTGRPLAPVACRSEA